MMPCPIVARWLAYCAREYAANNDVISLDEFKHAVNMGVFK